MIHKADTAICKGCGSLIALKDIINTNGWVTVDVSGYTLCNTCKGKDNGNLSNISEK